MLTPEGINDLLGQVLGQFGHQPGSSGKDTGEGGNGSDNGGKAKSPVQVTPAQALVIAGLITGALTVDSVLVDKNQTVQIVLEGSLKRKTAADRLLEQLGPMPLDDVLRAVVDRYA